MSDDLDRTTLNGVKTNDAAFITTRQQGAWHALGIHKPGAKVTATEAVVEYLKNPTVEIINLPYPPEIGGMSGVYVVARTDVQPIQEYAHVTKKYWHVTPLEFAEALDKGSKNRPIATCGLLNTGLLFWCYELGKKTICGQEYDLFQTLGSDMSGKSMNWAIFSPECTVCRNTWISANERAFSKAKIPHDKNAKELTEKWAALQWEQVNLRIERTVEVMQMMGDRRLTEEEEKEAVAIAVPIPPEPRKNALGLVNDLRQKMWEIECRRAVERRLIVWELYQGKMLGYDDLSKHHGTSYHIFAAIVDAWEHTIDARGPIDRAQAFLDGNRRSYINAAFDYLVSLF